MLPQTNSVLAKGGKHEENPNPNSASESLTHLLVLEPLLMGNDSVDAGPVTMHLLERHKCRVEVGRLGGGGGLRKIVKELFK